MEIGKNVEWEKRKLDKWYIRKSEIWKKENKNNWIFGKWEKETTV